MPSVVIFKTLGDMVFMPTTRSPSPEVALETASFLGWQPGSGFSSCPSSAAALICVLRKRLAGK
jgi:hypothetical protein